MGMTFWSYPKQQMTYTYTMNINMNMNMNMIGVVMLLMLELVMGNTSPSIKNSSTFFTEVRCSVSGNYTPKSSYQYNLYTVLDTLISEASTGFGFHQATSSGPKLPQAYAFYLCRGDLSNQACRDCVIAARNYVLDKCPLQTEALIYYDECKLRFSNKSFFGIMDLSPGVIRFDRHSNRTGNLTRFKQRLRDTMSKLAKEAANGNELKKYATTKTKNTSTSVLSELYAVAQCSPDLTGADCERCLNYGIDQLPISTAARVLLPSCCVRYDSKPFFAPNTSQKKHFWKVIIITVATFVTTFVLACGIWIFVRKKKALQMSNLEIIEIRTMESLEFDLSSIRVATNNFSEHNRLGKGGFGEVYKGILKDGQEVAIKRLSENSQQGIEEFKTEVLVLAKLQHKNLVKLLGFCFASKEKILVYELLQNSSLDHFLSDSTKKLSLDWEVRLKLIVGIAKGLLYLHEDSRLKIIHRDLKPSNILLDENMNPKISDFGLAKLFGVDQTQDDTMRIVGTYGYMAPEYAMTGHFSAKTDVYSFGIIILEIVCGQKNKFFGCSQWEEALIYRAWRLWKDKRSLELVDRTLEGKYPKEEVRKCIQLGLLCIQEKPTDRPTMATIVAALNGESISLPSPKTPSFIGASTTQTVSCPFNSCTSLQAGGKEFEHTSSLDHQQGYVVLYTGTDNITDLHPR